MEKHVNVEQLLNNLPNDLPYKASVKRVLVQAPTADVVEVVRCCECKNGERYVVNNDTFLYKCRKMGISGFADDFYCGYGARE